MCSVCRVKRFLFKCHSNVTTWSSNRRCQVWLVFVMRYKIFHILPEQPPQWKWMDKMSWATAGDFTPRVSGSVKLYAFFFFYKMWENMLSFRNCDPKCSGLEQWPWPFLLQPSATHSASCRSQQSHCSVFSKILFCCMQMMFSTVHLCSHSSLFSTILVFTQAFRFRLQVFLFITVMVLMSYSYVIILSS